MPVLTLVRIQGQVSWNCHLSSQGHWIGVCEPLKLTLQADAWGELMEDISMAQDALLKEQVTSNDLPAFLKEHGWIPMGPLPHENDLENVHFDLPFLPVMAGSNGQTRYISK